MFKCRAFKGTSNNDCNVEVTTLFAKGISTATVKLEKWGAMTACYRLTVVCC